MGVKRSRRPHFWDGRSTSRPTVPGNPRFSGHRMAKCALRGILWQTRNSQSWQGGAACIVGHIGMRCEEIWRRSAWQGSLAALWKRCFCSVNVWQVGGDNATAVQRQLSPGRALPPVTDCLRATLPPSVVKREGPVEYELSRSDDEVGNGGVGVSVSERRSPKNKSVQGWPERTRAGHKKTGWGCQPAFRMSAADDYIIGPCIGGVGGTGSGMSAITHSVVRNMPATEAAFWRAIRATLVGSITPAS